MKKYLEAGRIVNTHGVRGEVRIQPWADSPDFLLDFKTLYIDEKPYLLASGKEHKGMLIAQFAGVEDVSEAMLLKNKMVFIDRREARLPRGSFFIQDIIGAAVLDEEGRELGKLQEVLDLPASKVYVVRGEREILIPVVPDFVLKTDVEAGEIVVRLIDGM